MWHIFNIFTLLKEGEIPILKRLVIPSASIAKNFLLKSYMSLYTHSELVIPTKMYKWTCVCVCVF